MKSGTVTKAEFARRMGVSPPAVSKAIRTGRISVRADGKIDYASARAQWLANTDPERTWVKPKPAATSSSGKEGEEDEVVEEETSVVSDEALTKIKALLSEQGVAVDGPLTIQLARPRSAHPPKSATIEGSAMATTISSAPPRKTPREATARIPQAASLTGRCARAPRLPGPAGRPRRPGRRRRTAARPRPAAPRSPGA